MNNKELIIKLLKEELETKDYSPMERRWLEDVISTIESKLAR